MKRNHVQRRAHRLEYRTKYIRGYCFVFSYLFILVTTSQIFVIQTVSSFNYQPTQLNALFLRSSYDGISSSIQLLAKKDNNSGDKSLFENEEHRPSRNVEFVTDRRAALLSSTSIAAAAFLISTSTSNAKEISLMSAVKSGKIDDLTLGVGQWLPEKSLAGVSSASSALEIPASFSTYASRFLINYDSSVASWWNNQEAKVSLLSKNEIRSRLGESFGGLSQSIEVACQKFVDKRRSDIMTSFDQKCSSSGTSSTETKELCLKDKEKYATTTAYNDLAELFISKYGRKVNNAGNFLNNAGTAEADLALRHIGILFSTLPSSYQPQNVLQRLANDTDKILPLKQNQIPSSLDQKFTENERELLSTEYRIQYSSATKSYEISPDVTLWQIGFGDRNGNAATATVFGPLASTPLKRSLPFFGPNIYTLLGISGGIGCAMTHTFVIPLDVVKTRMQTNPGQYKGVFDGAITISQDEGPKALLLGAQATIAGYLWYGLSVYPSYTFFKRFFGLNLDPAFALLHANDIALLAGAITAVIASIGLTPLEACRIRTVADPDKYMSLGLKGTAASIAAEYPDEGYRALWGGFNSLVTRQVIFGSIKFLAFERACEVINAAFPTLRDGTITALLVTLLGGGFAGALSSVVSQPADSVLTYVSRKGGGLNIIEGCKVMIDEEGPTSLFRGLGSRCVWAGTIIAGQFLLYDIFRTILGVDGKDLSQVFDVVIDSGMIIS